MSTVRLPWFRPSAALAVTAAVVALTLTGCSGSEPTALHRPASAPAATLSQPSASASARTDGLAADPATWTSETAAAVQVPAGMRALLEEYTDTRAVGTVAAQTWAAGDVPPRLIVDWVVVQNPTRPWQVTEPDVGIIRATARTRHSTVVLDVLAGPADTGTLVRLLHTRR